MRVLFLGGAGMIGSAAAAEAVSQGADVTIVTRSEPRRAVPLGARALRRRPGRGAAAAGNR